MTGAAPSLPPVRAVLDRSLRMPGNSRLLHSARATPLWVIASETAEAAAATKLGAAGAQVIRVATDLTKPGLDLAAVLHVLHARGISRLMVEGGPILAASFVENDLVDEAVLLHGVKSVGAGGIDPLEGMPLSALTGRLTSLGSEKLDVDTIETFVRV